MTPLAQRVYDWLIREADYPHWPYSLRFLLLESARKILCGEIVIVATKLLVVLAFTLQLTGQSKRPVIEYDPEKLAANEVACGRAHGRASTPCSCMKHRAEAAQKRFELCQAIDDKKQRRECSLSADACAVTPTDRDTAGWDDGKNEPMPAQCSRSCHKARCECCHS